MILVTGGSGRVGSHLVNALLQKKYFLRVLERSAKGFRKRKNLELFIGDIIKKEDCEAAMKGIHIVFHLAAIVDYLAPKKLVYDVNVSGTRNIVETAKKIEKEAGGIIVRSVDIVGQGFEEGYQTVIEKISEGKMQIIGDGKNLIQYIHVSDLVRGLLLASEKGRAGEVYILAGPEAKTQEECFALLAKFLKAKPPQKKISVELARFVARVNLIKSKLKRKRPSFIPAYVDKIVANREFDISKAREELGFEPKVNADEQAREMVEEYLKKRK